MKIKLDGTQLFNALKNISIAVAQKSTLEVLKGVLIEAKDNRVTFTTTDMEVWASDGTTAEVTEPGSTLVIASSLFEFTKLVKYTEVELESKEGHLFINTNILNANFKTLPMELFPQKPEIAEKNHVIISQNSMKSLAKHISFAASNDLIRPILMYALIEIGKGNATAIALDGFRMAIKNEEYIETTGEFKIFIKSRILKEIGKIIVASGDPVIIAEMDQHVSIKFGSMTIIGRIPEENFIKYNEIIPKKFAATLKINAENLKGACKRVGIFIKKNGTEAIVFNINKSIEVYSNTAIGKISTRIDQDVDGIQMKIGFRKMYLMQGIEACNGEIELSFIAPNKLMMIENQESGYKYIVLPSRVREE